MTSKGRHVAEVFRALCIFLVAAGPRLPGGATRPRAAWDRRTARGLAARGFGSRCVHDGCRGRCMSPAAAIGPGEVVSRGVSSSVASHRDERPDDPGSDRRGTSDVSEILREVGQGMWAPLRTGVELRRACHAVHSLFCRRCCSRVTFSAPSERGHGFHQGAAAPGTPQPHPRCGASLGVLGHSCVCFVYCVHSLPDVLPGDIRARAGREHGGGWADGPRGGVCSTDAVLPRHAPPVHGPASLADLPTSGFSSHHEPLPHGAGRCETKAPWLTPSCLRQEPLAV